MLNPDVDPRHATSLRGLSSRVAAYVVQRNDLLVTLGQLSLQDWHRAGTFTGTVRGRNQTVLTYVQRIISHEGEHLDEISMAMHARRQVFASEA